MSQSHQTQHQHWSGYSISSSYARNDSPVPSAYPGRRSPATSPIGPVLSPCVSPSPPKSLSSSPRDHNHKDSHHSHSHSHSSSPSGSGHSSRKLDSIFRHLVKWSSPHKDKDKKHHEMLSPSPPPTAEHSKPTTISHPIAMKSTSSHAYPRSQHHHNYYSEYCQPRPATAAGYHRRSSDDYDDDGEFHKAENQEEEEHSPPTSRIRSKSLDLATTRQYLRNRRLSGDIPARAKDSSQTHHTYTIYESIIQDGARRASLHSHRPSDVSLDPAHAAILFRDSRGLPLTDPFIERILSLSSEDEENEILVKFFKFHKCYDLIPTSAKLVVFDTQLLVKKAFFALVYNGVRAAPLWDSDERKVVGMLTITDFIRVLHAMYHDSAGVGSKMSELEEHRVETWRRRFLLNKQPLVSIDPDSSLYDAICSLVNNRIHRLPVIDKHTGNVLHILTHKRILKFLFLYIHEIPRPSCLNNQLREVRIGSFDNIETAREETPIIVALQKFLDRRVSALPIVDDQNRLLDIYARFDVINLAAEKTYNNLDITLKQANEHRNEWFEGVHKCTLDDTLFMIMERIVKAEVHRLVVVDEHERVIGVISLSDILQYLVMRPELKEVSVSDIEEAIRHDKEVLENGKAALLKAEMDQINYQCQPSVLVDGALDENNAERENPTIFEEDEKT